jgi:phosphohistidine swiveling domain-containing protein
MRNILIENLRNDGIKNSKKIEEIIAAFSFPEEESVYQKRELELFKIAKASKNKKNLVNKLKNFIRKYKWTYFSHYTGNTPSIKSLLEKISSKEFNKSMEKSITISTKKLEKIESIIQHNKLSYKAINDFKKFRKLLTFNEKVLSSVFFFQYTELPVYLKVCSYLNDKIENLINYPPNLIERFYKIKKVYKKPIYRFVIAVLNKRLVLITKEEKIREIENLIKYKNLKKSVTVIKGSPVYPGKVRGHVIIVEKKSDRKKVKENSIIVTPMITPTDIDILPKAKGVITDEGGILTHAAVLCREFKVPGIVGTKIASKILKDGDEVILDATKGIVKKLG